MGVDSSLRFGCGDKLHGKVALSPQPHIMNHLLIGDADKTDTLLGLAPGGFLLIDDGPIADAFVREFAHAVVFDISKHTFNPLKSVDYKAARELAALFYAMSPQGENTLTVRNGRRALTRMLLAGTRLDKLGPGETDAEEEAAEMVADVLLSPVIKQVVCAPTNFSFSSNRKIIVRLDRAVLGDFDAFVLGNLLIRQFQGQVIVPDFSFYGREFHVSLLRQNRLFLGLNFFEELKDMPRLLNQVLLVKDKTPIGTTVGDAELLARFARIPPGTVGFGDFVDERIA